jgi:hypothetical protein
MNCDIYSLTDPGRIHIADSEGKIWYGCDQEWFPSYWQRMAGCGPCVASNIILYLLRSGRIALPFGTHGKDDIIRLMQTAWEHVTPTARGLNTPELMKKGMEDFSNAHSFKLKCSLLNIPKKQAERPPFSEMAGFIAEGLASDSPVAFLNLSNGAVKNLDSWHWVTIVSLTWDRDNDSVFANVFDGEREMPIDLKLWYETTTLGGGFVYFRTEDAV